ncbi:MAG: hypothetical protein E6Q97_15950 [Desulfurellales bacterium]|nr:MAG: hypothetical protein E6Q97_15950 [Desulfurellales bacterium]
MHEEKKKKKGMGTKIKEFLVGDGSNSPFSPETTERIDRAAQGAVARYVTSVSPQAGNVLRGKMERYNKATYGDQEMSESRGKALRVGARVAGGSWRQ